MGFHQIIIKPMRKRRSKTLRIFAFGILFGFHTLSIGQEIDSLIFSYSDFIEIVRNHHPLALNAELKISEGEAQLLLAKGGFDPKVLANIAQKNYNDQQYYSKFYGGLKIPTWFGLEFQGGYEQNQGNYLNLESTNPNGGLIYTGVSLTLGQGLLMDKRRAELKKAKLYQKITEADKTLLMNELVYEASLAYWKWFKVYNSVLVHQEAFKLAIQRFEGVKDMAFFGERPNIDTVEAGIQVQNRLLSLQQAQLDFRNASALLSVYLWSEGIVPLELNETTTPHVMRNVTGNSVSMEVYAQRDSLLVLHPELQKSMLKIDQIEIEKRWKKEKLKPVLNLTYNPITEPVGGQTITNFSLNNYTWGMEFKMPIFLREERGSLKLTDIELQQSRFDLSQKQAAFRFKITAAINQWQTTKQQVDLYTQTVESYLKLLEGERELFDNGESSLFMINSREMGYIKAKIKLIELLTKNREAELKTRYSLGSLL